MSMPKLPARRPGATPGPRKRFGQHFLEPAWAEKLVAAIAPAPSDCFVEVGPGRGALTAALASHAAQVVAIEIDRDLAAGLSRRGLSRTTIIVGDVLKANLHDLGRRAQYDQPDGRLRLAGNLPFNISSPVLIHILAAQRAGSPFHDATVMLQREVADRLVAQPGTRGYGPLAIMAAVQADTTRLLSLPPWAFRPMPRVRSAVVGLTFRPSPVEIPDYALFEALVRRLFQHRRKMLANALVPFAEQFRVEAAAWLAHANLDGRRRPETLQLAELARLATALEAVPERAVL